MLRAKTTRRAPRRDREDAIRTSRELSDHVALLRDAIELLLQRRQ